MNNKHVYVRDLVLSRGTNFTLTVPRLSVKPGEILCITGPNGSGKSSLLGCLSGLIQSDEGKIYIHGSQIDHNLRKTKSLIGLIPDDEEWLIAELTATEYFSLLRNVYIDAGVHIDFQTREKHLANELGFSAYDQPLSSLSHGNKKKVQIIAGLIHKPEVIIIDELRNGLDPISIIAAERLIEHESRNGAAIIAATHDLWWAERIASQLIILDNGNMVFSGDKRKAVHEYGGIEQLFISIAGQRSR